MTEDQNKSEALVQRLEKLEETINRPKPKDLWDKLSALSTLFSGIIIAGLGLYVTSVYNQRQLEATSAQKERELAVLELQTVETFFEHLSSDDQGLKRSALEAIASLGDIELAAKLAANLGGDGGRAFLHEISSSSNNEVANLAQNLLKANQEKQVKKLDIELSHRLRILGDLIQNGTINDKVMSEVQNVLEETPPGQQNYMIGGSIYLFEEYANKNVTTILQELQDLVSNDRKTQIQEARQAVEEFKSMILSTPTREVSLAEHIVDSVPAFKDEQLKMISQQILLKLAFWISYKNVP